ncbi:MAG TPA: sulfurtransferase TusA family protein [Actinomycetota bacterium]
MATQTLDVRGVACPMPIVRTSQAIKTLDPGDTLEVLATDRGSVTDVPSWCTTTGNELVEQSEDGGVFRFVVRKVA